MTGFTAVYILECFKDLIKFINMVSEGESKTQHFPPSEIIFYQTGGKTYLTYKVISFQFTATFPGKITFVIRDRICDSQLV